MKKLIIWVCSVILPVALVLYYGRNQKPVLDKITASQLLSNGMDEMQVYKILGTNMSISTGRNGEKFLHYFFPFTGEPPGVRAKIDNITVIISNKVVIDRGVADSVWSK